MLALRHLWQLHLVADEDDVVGAKSRRHDIGETHLACFVNEQHVDRAGVLGAGPHP